MAESEKNLSEAAIRAALAENLVRLLAERGMSQHALSRATGISIGTVNKTARELHSPSIVVVAKIASALGVSVDALIGLPKPSRKRRKVA